MDAKRITPRRIATALFVALTALAVAAPAAEARPTAQVSAPTAGSCAVTPNPVAVGQSYVVSGGRFGAGVILNVYVTDRAGTQWGSVRADSSGAMRYSGVASVSGSYSVKITDSGRKPATLASCAFSAR